MAIGRAIMAVTIAAALAWVVVPLAHARASNPEITRVSETMAVRGAGWLNIRSGPGTGFQRIDRLANGTAVQVTGRIEGSGWLRIELPDGREAWAHGDYLGAVTSGQSAAGKPTAATRPPADCRHDSEAWNKRDWPSLYRACPASAVAAHNAAVVALRDGDLATAQRIAADGLRRNPGVVALQHLADPFASAARLANAKLTAWFTGASKLPAFESQPPGRPDLPPLPELVKDEFETTVMFRERVAKAEQDRASLLENIEADYRREVTDYNKAVTRRNEALREEQAARRRELPQKRSAFFSEALTSILGAPRFTDAQYDADRQQFLARLVTAHGLMDRPVIIDVPLAVARTFKQELDSVVPVITLDIDAETLRIAGIAARHGETRHIAAYSDKAAPVEPVRVQLADVGSGSMDVAELETLQPERIDREGLLAENRAFFGEAIRLEEDPALARQRQQLAELERQRREAEARKERDAERQRLAGQIRRQQDALARLGGPEGDAFRGLAMKREWSFPPPVEPARDLVGVVIGNREYGRGIPLVHYAHNDARAVRQWLIEGMGVAEENVMMELDATKGVMEGLFRSTLPARVRPGVTDVFVYFSGHGMPEGGSARLLPSDARPNQAAVTGYDRDRLLAELSGLNARSVTLVLDACFTGTDKSGSGLLAAKPVLRAPETAAVPPGMVLVTASRGDEIAWSDDETGQSLMTLHLLQGLAGDADADDDGAVTTAELGVWLPVAVNRAALRGFERQQRPSVSGSGRVLAGPYRAGQD